MEGMRSFVRSHRKLLDPQSTYVINIDSVGRGDVRFELGEGPAVTYELDSRLTELATAIAIADAEDGNRYRAVAAAPRLRDRRARAAAREDPGDDDHLPRARRDACRPTTTPPSDRVDALDPKAIDRAHKFTLELIRQLDRDVGRRR